MTELSTVVVGTGILGQRHARVWQQLPGARVAGVVDIDAERAKAVGTKYDVPWATDLAELLIDDAVGAVSIATPDHLHRDSTLTALAAGKHVFVEKPLATTAVDARDMVAAADRAGVVLQVNFSQRWLQDYAYIKAVLDAGEIGAVKFITSAKRDTVYVPTAMIGWAAATSPIFFMTSHDLDLVRWFLGAEPQSVIARRTSGVLAGRGVATDDSVHALVSFTDDTLATFSTAWIHAETFPMVAEDRLEIVGERGSIDYCSRDRTLQIYSNGTAREIRFTGPATATERHGQLVGAFVDSCQYFLDCAQTGARPTTTAADSLPAVACQEAVLQSAAAGGIPITLD